eukprot:XP_011677739.1 PREDICTED: solute carrier family 12 member 9 [Strongylocentrotus purpuratus]
MADLKSDLQSYLSTSSKSLSQSSGSLSSGAKSTMNSMTSWFSGSKDGHRDGDVEASGNLLTGGTPKESKDGGDTNGWFTQAEKDPFCPSLSRQQRIIGFMGCLAAGVFCFVLAWTFAPLIVVKPRKFALLYTLGSVFSVGRLFFVFNNRDLLKNDYNFLQHVNVVGPLIAVGVIAATLSTSLSTLIGGSRVLVALAKDRVFGSVTNPIARGVTKGGNPIAALLVCWFMVQMVLFIGELNAIGPLVSVFFLLSYACVNLACLALEVASAPNFRPSFKYFSWHTSLLGMIGCIIMLFLIEPLWAFVAIGLFIFLLVVVIIWGPHNQWGYVGQALIFHQVRKYLLLLDIRKAHVKFWRPQILLLVSNPRASTQLIRFVNDMKKSGLYVIGHVKTGLLDECPYDPVQQEYPAWLYLVESLKVKAFVELTLAPSVREGVMHLMRISGLGGMKPNTVVMGFYDDRIPVNSLNQTKAEKPSRFRFTPDTDEEEMGQVLTQLPKIRTEAETKALSADQYVLMISDAVRLRKNICLARHFSSLDMDALLNSTKDSFIDVWPVNFLKPELAGYLDTACIFLLQLACVLHMVPKWNRHTRLRVFLCVDSDYTSTKKKKAKLNKFLLDLRINAEIVTVPWNHITSLNTYQMNSQNGDIAPSLVMSVSEEYLLALNNMVRDYTSSTSAVFCYLPLAPADPQYHMTYLRHLDLLTQDLPPTMLVHGFSEVTSTVM